MLKRILVADDQPSVRSALKLVLEQQGMTVVGDVADYKQLLDWLAINQADLVLMDWELPGQPGEKTIAALHSLYPSLSVFVLDSTPQTRVLALAAGADNFVCKGDPAEYLLRALRWCSPGDNEGQEFKSGTNNKREVI